MKDEGDSYGVADTSSFSRYFDLDAWYQHKILDNIKELPRRLKKTFPLLIEPKASKSEKNKGLKDVKLTGNETNPHTVRRYNPVCLKCGGSKISCGNKGTCHCENPEWKQQYIPVANNHPTTKPVKLMNYLITLGSRKGDTVLDPFTGSGTTGIAAVQLSRRFIGIEREKDYSEIAKRRLIHQVQNEEYKLL